MADNRTMAQLLEAPTEGYEDAIVVPEITANNFEIKHGLLNLVQNKQFFGHDKEDPHAHIRYFNKITSTMKFPNVPSTSSKVRHSRSKAVVSKVSTSISTPEISSDVAELKDMVKALLLDKKNQNQPSTPAPVKAVEQSCINQLPTFQAPPYQAPAPAPQAPGTDKSEITRKQSKTGKHGHGNQKSTNRSQRIKAEARNVKPQSKAVKQWSTKVNKTHNIPFSPSKFH
ncbi:hypothetical protein Tco_1268940 [Tanacetum coccineum]